MEIERGKRILYASKACNYIPRMRPVSWKDREMPTKFMQSLDPQVYAELRKIAKDRGITMQELIRAVIVPDWMRKDEGTGAGRSPRRSRTARNASKRARARITA
jgi:hypothetical protein